MAEVFIIAEGYSKNFDDRMEANCTCTLIKGKHNIIVDTMTPWDGETILKGLTKLQIKPEDINWVINTHTHADHIGNNNLFLKAKHISGFSISEKDVFFNHPFDKGESFIIDENVKIVPTPGHTLTDVSVVVKSKKLGTFAITGDLFEREEDIKLPILWKTIAGSENIKKQTLNRNKIGQIADWIVPGHGPMFKVTDEIKDILQKAVDNQIY